MIGCSGPTTDLSEGRTWSTYKADPKASSYSPLDQINTSNVNGLQNVWTFQSDDVPPGGDPVSSQSNPIIIDGTMYANSAKQSVYAINARTGELAWTFHTIPHPGEPGYETWPRMPINMRGRQLLGGNEHRFGKRDGISGVRISFL